MGIEPTSDSDCRSTVLKLDNRTSLAWAETALPQVRGLVRCPPLSPADPSVPLLMAREWHAVVSAPASQSASGGVQSCNEFAKPVETPLQARRCLGRDCGPPLLLCEFADV